MSEVDAIVEAIAEIADRTNLLALNASIEAARAGGAGSGFAVVAEEVKRLAEETQSSAAEVESRLADLGERTDASVEEMAAIRASVEDGVAVIEEAETALNDVSERVAAADDGVQEITGAMDAQATAVSEVTGAVDELAGISEQTTAEATTVASTAEEQVATLGTVSESAHDLERRASALRERVGRFETASAGSVSEIDSSEPPTITDPAHEDDRETSGPEHLHGDDLGVEPARSDGGADPHSER
ncbi:methyl-accepting chemotaxis protein [Halorubrum vacuolatum]|uniref:Methyl-accepting chemotaxis protein (MCP) signalling domain-containing protein n=1 Tax=Halorubrum vacuolatum TaxID=63740 RepID=A0A238VCW6_HALVU|nr:methyl-accepting chemotaxis protein [Halorubrum vacuolatum]SNR31887.1 Methyl-accepting chemotaxis protein (MCP) signalling domain-containing protein [Halorubrum vacuolatum]